MNLIFFFFFFFLNRFLNCKYLCNIWEVLSYTLLLLLLYLFSKFDWKLKLKRQKKKKKQMYSKCGFTTYGLFSMYFSFIVCWFPKRVCISFRNMCALSQFWFLIYFFFFFAFLLLSFVVSIKFRTDWLAIDNLKIVFER